jgi:hypothetical protein
MRHLRALAFATLFAAPVSAAAQDTGFPQPPPKKPVPQGSILGHVTCTDTHRPARGAKIMLYPLGENGDDQALMSISGLDGSFLAPHVPPGEYAIIAFAAGYLTPLDGVEYRAAGDPNHPSDPVAEQKKMEAALRRNAPIVRVSGAETERIDIELRRGAILSGKVVYADGSPASQLRVALQKTGQTKPEANPSQPTDMATMIRTYMLQQPLATDDQGHFRIAGIAPGSYRLAVTQPFDMGAGDDLTDVMMVAFNPATQQSGKLTVYSGNTLHRKEAKVYDLRAADIVDGIEIVLPLDGLHSIRGAAAAKDGALLNAGMITLVDTSDPAISFHSTVLAGGDFRFNGIPEGTYELKLIGGRIYENENVINNSLGGEDASQYQRQLQNLDQQFKPSRAFADTTVSVIVQTTDIDNLTVTLQDTKLPDPPTQQDPSEPIHMIK